MPYIPIDNECDVTIAIGTRMTPLLKYCVIINAHTPIIIIIITMENGLSLANMLCVPLCVAHHKRR